MITVAVRQVSHTTPRTRVINLDVASLSFNFSAGQAVLVGLHGSSLRKPYSIASAPWELAKTGVLQLLAQIDDSGSLDPHLELAAPGTLIDVEGPFGSFGLRPEFDDLPLLFVAGGTGIAPLRSMLMDRLARPRVPPISLVYSARSIDEFAFRTELEAMSTVGRINAYFTMTRPDSGPWHGRRGRIDEALLQEALPAADCCCLICGPPQLIRDASVLLALLGVEHGRILSERF